ncbi:hypothetical protein BDY21DRAFT_411954 [Lineolata rhizophorae]|uniref:DUF7165 domain-containing protein n=1 Tax=Lineolata rhizophorae TaxID=578093 RepID=A0A6A6P4L0_9PEZI|nr:hypothetical protein BDY21DRAFT_411954 [Lineolata rhizophorae]
MASRSPGRTTAAAPPTVPTSPVRPTLKTRFDGDATSDSGDGGKGAFRGEKDPATIPEDAAYVSFEKDIETGGQTTAAPQQHQQNRMSASLSSPESAGHDSSGRSTFSSVISGGDLDTMSLTSSPVGTMTTTATSALEAGLGTMTSSAGDAPGSAAAGPTSHPSGPATSDQPITTIIDFLSSSVTSSALPETLGLSVSRHGRYLLAFSSSHLYLLRAANLPSLRGARAFALKRRPLAVDVCDAEGVSVVAILADRHRVDVYDISSSGNGNGAGTGHAARRSGRQSGGTGNGGSVRLLRSVALVNPSRGIALAPDGKVMASAAPDCLEVVSLAPNATEADRRTLSCDGHESVVFSDDGTMLVATGPAANKGRRSGGKTTIYSVQSDLSPSLFLSEDAAGPPTEPTHISWIRRVLFPTVLPSARQAALIPDAHHLMDELLAFDVEADAFGVVEIATKSFLPHVRISVGIGAAGANRRRWYRRRGTGTGADCPPDATSDGGLEDALPGLFPDGTHVALGLKGRPATPGGTPGPSKIALYALPTESAALPSEKNGDNDEDVSHLRPTTSIPLQLASPDFAGSSAAVYGITGLRWLWDAPPAPGGGAASHDRLLATCATANSEADGPGPNGPSGPGSPPSARTRVEENAPETTTTSVGPEHATGRVVTVDFPCLHNRRARGRRGSNSDTSGSMEDTKALQTPPPPKRVEVVLDGRVRVERLPDRELDFQTEVELVRRRTVTAQRESERRRNIAARERERERVRERLDELRDDETDRRRDVLRSATTGPSSQMPRRRPVGGRSDSSGGRDRTTSRTSRVSSISSTSTNPVAASGHADDPDAAETDSVVSPEEAQAMFEAPYAHSQPRSQASLNRAATVAASSGANRRHLRALPSRPLEYRRADGLREHPHESDADDWVPPPPPYSEQVEWGSTSLGAGAGVNSRHGAGSRPGATPAQADQTARQRRNSGRRSQRNGGASDIPATTAPASIAPAPLGTPPWAPYASSSPGTFSTTSLPVAPPIPAVPSSPASTRSGGARLFRGASLFRSRTNSQSTAQPPQQPGQQQQQQQQQRVASPLPYPHHRQHYQHHQPRRPSTAVAAASSPAPAPVSVPPSPRPTRSRMARAGSLFRAQTSPAPASPAPRHPHRPVGPPRQHPPLSPLQPPPRLPQHAQSMAALPSAPRPPPSSLRGASPVVGVSAGRGVSPALGMSGEAGGGAGGRYPHPMV